MSYTPKSTYSWAFQPNEDGWVLKICNQVGTIKPTLGGFYNATLNDDWKGKFASLEDAMNSMKEHLAVELRNKAAELNYLADILLEPEDIVI
jgi:hypothetical protein